VHFGLHVLPARRDDDLLDLLHAQGRVLTGTRSAFHFAI
jgi:hypothetical protein